MIENGAEVIPPALQDDVTLVRMMLYLGTGRNPTSNLSEDDLCDLIIGNGLKQTAGIELACRPAVQWMAEAGVPFDAAAWQELASEAREEEVCCRAKLDELAPPSPDASLGCGWKWEDHKTVKRVFREAGIPLSDTSDAELAALEHPLADALRRYRRAANRASAFGENWLQFVRDGRLYPKWHQIGAATGRMSCSSPPVQGLLRDRRYRACIAAPPGRVLVKADYSQIELRIAARIAGDARMVEAYQQGFDLHQLTASQLMGKSMDMVTEEDRQLAKAVNFGLLYGAGPETLRSYGLKAFGVHLTLDEAKRYSRAFFQAYQSLDRWQEAACNSRSRVTRTRTGRLRCLAVGTSEDGSWFTRRLNSPVQGTGADGLKQALALLWDRREACLGAVPVIACHDEIVVECDSDQSEIAAAWLWQAMVEGMAPLIDPIPVDVEVAIGETWAG